MSRDRTPRPPAHTAVLIGALLLVTAGCSDGRPEVNEIADGLTTGTSLFPVAEQQAECAAEVLRDSELDDEVLTAIAESDTEHEISPDDASTLATLQVEVLDTCGA